jgi:hypothetical protein
MIKIAIQVSLFKICPSFHTVFTVLVKVYICQVISRLGCETRVSFVSTFDVSHSTVISENTGLQLKQKTRSFPVRKAVLKWRHLQLWPEVIRATYTISLHRPYSPPFSPLISSFNYIDKTKWPRVPSARWTP